MIKSICIVTGSRAEYGLLRPLIELIHKDKELNLQIVATGMHLSHEFGYTYKEIERDGFKIDEKIETLLSSDTSIGISKSMGLTVISFAECYSRLSPDMVVVLGDRYEAFAATIAASVAKIPVAHLHGGETTEGAFDEAFRHSITKMSYLHFTSTEEYRRRVIQLGEHPSRVFNVGAIGIDNIKRLQLLSKEEVETRINFILDKPYVMVTFHPVTLENNTSGDQFKELLVALDSFKDLKIIFTKANSDTDGRVINYLIDEYVAQNSDRSIAFTSMGILKYLSAMKTCAAVIGNSSSGIIEAPSFDVPTINIGDRQRGRIQSASTINCNPNVKEIKESIELVLSEGFRKKIKHIKNPYGDGNVSFEIVEKIKEFLFKGFDLKKTFYDLKVVE